MVMLRAEVKQHDVQSRDDKGVLTLTLPKKQGGSAQQLKMD
jgi:HSP20 family molecular chaperone IbpA